MITYWTFRCSGINRVTLMSDKLLKLLGLWVALSEFYIINILRINLVIFVFIIVEIQFFNISFIVMSKFIWIFDSPIKKSK